MTRAKTAIAVVGGLVILTGVPAHASFSLLGTGGFLTPDDLAIQPGAVAFAQDVFMDGEYVDPNGEKIHRIEHLNDGIYGNEHSWIQGDNPSYAAIRFASGAVINQVAWGSENIPNYGGTYYSDRYMATYSVQYTTAANPDTTTTAWIDIGSVTYGSYDLDHLDRQLYGFDPVYATGLRVVVDYSTVTPNNGQIRIDELEIYGVPEPSTCLAGLTALGLLGVGVWRGRK